MSVRRQTKKRLLTWAYRTTAIVLVLSVAILVILIVGELIRQESRRTAIDFFRERGGRITVDEQESPWFMVVVGQRTRQVEVGAFLNETRVTDDDLVRLRELPNLRVVYLDHTQITDEGLVHLAGLPKVRDLDLESTAITDKGVEVLSQRDSLEFVSLNDTRITDQALKHCIKLRNLDTLSLFGTDVSAGGIDYLKKRKPKLRIGWSRPPTSAHSEAQSFLEDRGAVFDRGQIPGQPGKVIYIASLTLDAPVDERWIGTLNDLDRLRDIEGLTSVFLEGNGFGDETLKQLSTVAGLQGVFIDDATVTDKGLRQLESLNSLKAVRLSGTSVTQAGIEAFKQARPDVQITKRDW